MPWVQLRGVCRETDWGNKGCSLLSVLWSHAKGFTSLLQQPWGWRLTLCSVGMVWSLPTVPRQPTGPRMWWPQGEVPGTASCSEEPEVPIDGRGPPG